MTDLSAKRAASFPKASKMGLVGMLLSFAWALAAAAQDSTPSQPSYSQPLGPLGIYAPGQWGVVAVDVANPTTETADLLASIYLVGDSSRQYGRQLWVPPRARRLSWFPLWLPSDISRDLEHVEARSLLFDRTLGEDVRLMSPEGAHAQTGMLPILRRRPFTGMIADEDDVHVRQTVMAMRRSQNRSERVVMLDVERLPRMLHALQAFDQLVLSSDALADSPALSAVRRWLYAGGRLWIMLDEVNSTTVAMLLGEDFGAQLVDRVELTDVKIEAAAGQVQYPDGRHQRFLQPVQLVRVLEGPGEVAYRAGNWPVAFWQRVGSGRVLFTTLEDRAWIGGQEEGQEQSPKLQPTDSVATEPLAALASEFLQARPPPVMPGLALRNLLEKQIGYRIVSRGVAASLLLGFSATMLVSAIWLTRRGKPERLAWFGSVVAIAAASLLLALGSAARRQVPETVVAAQFVRVFPGAELAPVTGLVALYRRESSTERLGGRDEAVMQLQTPSDTVATHRLVWTDLDTCHWENLTLRPGVHFAAYSSTLRPRRPMSARATFERNGVSGQLDVDSFQSLSDAIIVTPGGTNLAVRLHSDGRFSAAASDVLPKGQFFDGVAVADRQRERAEVYEELLAEGRPSNFPVAPCLLAWAEHTTIPLDLTADLPIQATALLALPLTIERPLRGTSITIPSAFLSYQSVSGRAGSPMSVAYDNSERRWIGPLTRGSQITLRIQIPEEVLPVKLHEARIEIRVQAPQRNLQIAAVTDGGTVVIKEFADPAGRLTCRIDDGHLLGLDENGGLLVVVTVGSRPDEQLAGISEVGWQIHDLSVEVSGVVVAD